MINRIVSCSCVAIALAACSSPEAMAEDLGVEERQTSASASGSGSSARSVSASDGAKEVAAETETYIFGYSWPSAVGKQTKLLPVMEAMEQKAEAELLAQSQEAKSDAANNSYPFNKHTYEQHWNIAADLPRYLSLTSGISTYGGGAHGNLFFEAMLWDKEAGQAMQAADLFLSPEHLQDAVQGRYCPQLNAMRAEKRGTPISADSDDSFDQCPLIDRLTLVLGSADGKKFSSITLLAAPYVAGPYVEGDYQLTLPVDRAVLDALTPDAVKYFEIGS